MKTFGSAALVGMFFLAAVHAGDDKALKKELEVLQGKWNVIKAETGGGAKNEDVKGQSMEFSKDGKSVEFSRGGETKKATFKLNPAAKPKEITIEIPGSDKAMQGIYKVEKDVLTICYMRKKERPTEFAVTKDEKFILITLEKAK